jgi:hypothetical protein
LSAILLKSSLDKGQGSREGGQRKRGTHDRELLVT